MEIENLKKKNIYIYFVYFSKNEDKDSLFCILNSIKTFKVICYIHSWISTVNIADNFSIVKGILHEKHLL